ncbi:MAG: 2Fe-2S iron-sulfur cluster binding domain-containing protein [Dehalococcoidia bacterium]|nr:MAG: 2Fe-2S iron-sulfur cluster binding domain-containing protein [Dehalococcoidia bacterium]
MKEITLTINGKQVKGREGDTVLEVCEANNIYVPTLCHLKGLTDVGACRMCVVDIERERRPVPACTYPARDGLVVQTHNENLEKYRRLILELMFTERNHLCAQCVASGDCELQNLAYEYQMDNVRYPYSWPALPLDSVNDYLVIDHNRCILCGRCIRTCDEIVGVHTLDFGHRGWKDAVIADLNQPLGASSCISCGACFQVCPTGAIFSKNSAYKGKPEECRKVNSICPICGVGCKIEALVKNNRLVRIDSPDLTGKRGILCNKGRFTPLYKKGERTTTALVKNGRGKLEPRPLLEAIDVVARKLAELKTKYGGNSIAGIASSQASNDSLKAFKELISGTIGSELIDTLDGDVYRTITRGINHHKAQGGLDIETSLEEILKADCIIVVGANPLESHPVVGSYIARAARRNKATLILIHPSQNTFPYHATLWLKPKENRQVLALEILSKAIIDKGTKKDSAKTKEIAASLKDINVKQGSAQAGIGTDDLSEAAEMLSKAKHSVIIYGEGVLQQENPALIESLLNLATVASSRNKGQLQVISLKPKGNSRGAWDMGIANSSQSIVRNLTGSNVRALYLLLSDDYVDASQLTNLSKGLEFIIIQSSYPLPARAKANVVLPSPSWAEVGEKYTTLDGLTKSTSRLIKPPVGIKADSEILREISKQMKK